MLGRLTTHLDQFLKGRNRLIRLVLLVIDRAQPLQEDAAIVLLLGGIRAVGMRGQIHHLLVDLGRFVVAAQHIQQQSLVVAGFERLRVLVERLLNCNQCIFILSLAAQNLPDVDENTRVFRVDHGQVLILFQGLVELAVVEQRLG